ncbi:MAG: 16S rRNA (adenine(1518)-N(6)/adenine(1519)-N(6))-dimethyltransferase RsmA [Ferruginibacter sp.]
MYTAKKSLGQHFLTSGKVISDILAVLENQAFSRLLEVGPGTGALTASLLKLPGIDFKAVELDDEKIIYLQQHFPAIKGKLIHADFLKMEKPFEEPFIVIGNFPYNISTQILFKVLEWREEVPCIIGMFQKEVAARAAAPPGSKVYGVLSALIQPYYDVTYLFDVPPESFTPPPKVTSAVIKLTRRKEALDVRSERAYWNLVKTAFNQRRKTMRNAVKGLFSPEVLTDEIFKRRAETFSIEEFAALTHRMS